MILDDPATETLVAKILPTLPRLLDCAHRRRSGRIAQHRHSDDLVVVCDRNDGARACIPTQ